MLHGMILSAAALLGLGLTMPSMTITTDFGSADGWIRWLTDLDEQDQTTYSLLSGIVKLLESDAAIGILLLSFSCFFPAIKLAIMSAGVEALRKGRDAGLLVRLTHHAGKFSMLDVLVVAMLILGVKGLPGGSEIKLGFGLWLFAGSVVLSLIASILMGRLERAGRPAPQLQIRTVDD